MSTILGLDIGTEYVKVVLARPNKNGQLEVVGAARAKQKEGSMYAGAIADITAVVATCEDALIEAEEQAGERADTTVVGVAGELIKGNTTTVRYKRQNPNTPISEAEMSEIIKKVQQKSGEVAREAVAIETGNSSVEVRLINSAIISLTIDGYKISNPIGFKGSDVMIQFYTAFAPLIHVAAIEKVCAELNLDLLTVAVEPFAVCRACLGDDADSTFSSVVMDIGGGTTDIAVVDDGCVEGTKMFSIGGRSFTHQIEEALDVDFESAEKLKLAYDNGSLDDRLRSKIEAALSRNMSVWLAGIEVALEEFQSVGSLPKNILLCGGGASLSLLQEQLAVSSWYVDLPFPRRPVIQLLEVTDFPGFVFGQKSKIDHSFATALGLARVGLDTIAGSPEENKLKKKISKILQN